MNATRRNQIAAIKEKLQTLTNELETLQEQEQEAFDNMPEGLQMGERGQKSEDAANALGDCISNLQTAVEDLEAASE